MLPADLLAIDANMLLEGTLLQSSFGLTIRHFQWFCAR